jgi:galactokinase
LGDLAGAARSAFAARFGNAAHVVASAPGRINVIGEHTDYCAGLALPGAVDRWLLVALAPRGDGRLRVHSEALAETAECDSGAGPDDVSGWGAVPAGAAALLREASGLVGGFDALIAGNVPRGAGLSSSAALEMALLNALRTAFAVQISDLELVRLAQRIEHEWLGTPTGLMDQYTAQFARADELLLIDFREVAHERVAALLEGYVWLLLDSGVRHDLADSAYGERVAEMRAALAAVACADPSVAGFRDLRASHADLIDDALLRRRLRHYVRENERVRRAVDALRSGDATALGSLLNRSHASLRDDYQVSCDELDQLADVAASISGCAGARMMGGGFGGCTINLVRVEAVDRVIERVSAEFAQRFGAPAGAAVYRLVGGARVHGDDETA